MRSLVLALGVSLLVLPATAQAHFTLLQPPPASSAPDGKGGPPCGPKGNLTNVVTAVTGGSKLTLKVNETVGHPGFYRVALSINSRSELPADNVVKDSTGKVLTPIVGPGNSATADYQQTPVFPVLADNLFPHPDQGQQMFTGEVTLPNVNCEKCTLQVIEFMAEHGPDYFYRNCADLKITADPSKPLFTPGGGGAGGAGGTGGGASSAGGGGASAGTGGTTSAGTGGASAGAPSAGAPSAAGSAGAGVAGSGVGGAAGAGVTPPSEPADDGGCSLSPRGTGSKTVLALLVGLLVLGRRRRAAR